MPRWVTSYSHALVLAGPILAPVGDEEFADYVASRLAGLPGVLDVSLGGSRASGAARPDSDWDFAVYYRGRFDRGELRVRTAARSLGCPGWAQADAFSRTVQACQVLAGKAS